MRFNEGELAQKRTDCSLVIEISRDHIFSEKKAIMIKNGR